MNNNDESKKMALHYMETLVDVAHEAFLIIDSGFRVLSANQIFYETFMVEPAQTVNQILYDLGNGQWNIPELKDLLENVLPQKKVVRDFQVTHVFETIGEKTMLLNARQIDTVQLIILAIEDITVRVDIAKKLAENAQNLTVKVGERTQELDKRIKELEELNRVMVGRELKMIELKNEIESLKNKP